MLGQEWKDVGQLARTGHRFVPDALSGRQAVGVRASVKVRDDLYWNGKQLPEETLMIEGVNLHDATLIAIRLNWDDGTCVADLDHGTLGRCVLTFSAVSHLILPRKQDWGRSVSINTFSVPSLGQYEIEMQSGDLIKIEAASVKLATVNHPSFP